MKTENDQCLRAQWCIGEKCHFIVAWRRQITQYLTCKSWNYSEVCNTQFDTTKGDKGEIPCHRFRCGSLWIKQGALRKDYKDKVSPLRIWQWWSMNMATAFNQGPWRPNLTRRTSNRWHIDKADTLMEVQGWNANPCPAFHVWTIFTTAPGNYKVNAVWRVKYCLVR